VRLRTLMPGAREAERILVESSAAAHARAQPRALRIPAPLLLLAWVAAAALLQLVRAPGLPAWRVVWAEDGTIFLQQALTKSLPAALGTTYAGYLHVVPRLLAEPAAALPLGAAAAVMAVEAAVVVALLGAYVYVASATLFETRWARALLVLLFVFAPPAYTELGASLANLHWYGLVASFFALLHRPESRRQSVAGAAVVGLTALSDPMLALLLPLLTLRPGGLSEPRWGERLIPAAALAGLAVQALAILLASAGPERQAEFWPPDLATIFAQRVAGPGLIGSEWFGDLWLRAGWAAAFGALALLAVLVVRAAYRGDPVRRRHARLAAAAACALFAVPMAIRGTSEMAPQLGVLFGGGARYTFAPIVLMWVPLLLLADRARGWAARLAVLAVLVVAGSSTGATERSLGPDWPRSVAHARTTCAAGATSARETIAPTNAPWAVRLPCGRL
jgi:hypothetical protein